MYSKNEATPRPTHCSDLADGSGDTIQLPARRSRSDSLGSQQAEVVPRSDFPKGEDWRQLLTSDQPSNLSLSARLTEPIHDSKACYITASLWVREEAVKRAREGEPEYRLQ